MPAHNSTKEAQMRQREIDFTNFEGTILLRKPLIF